MNKNKGKMLNCKLKVSEKGGSIFQFPFCIDQNSKTARERKK